MLLGIYVQVANSKAPGSRNGIKWTECLGDTREWW